MKKPNVWVVWSPDGDLNFVNTLCFGDGSARVYEKDRYDTRCTLGSEEALPYFRTLRGAIAFLIAHPGKLCQVDTRTNLFNP